MSRVALAPGNARSYETIYILRPNLDKEKADDVANRIAEAIKSHNGVVTNAEVWGSRRLAFPIERHHRGTYVFVSYLGRGGLVAEIERQLRLVDAVIRFQTVVVQDNVPMNDVAPAPEGMKLDFALPFEADEPELTRERALGLDGPLTEPRRRPRRDDFDDDDMDGDDGPDMGMGGDSDDDEGDA
jgi:small subunit ribosomal protein S6